MAQRPYADDSNKWYDPVTDFAGELFEGDSQLSEDLQDFAYSLNREYIGAEVENTYQDIEDRFANQQVQRSGNQVANWLSNPVNLIITFLGVVGTIILVRKM